MKRQLTPHRCLVLLSLPLLFAVAPVARAQCAGFTDVAAADPFCANVEWIRNRDITLGCGDGTLYCPGQSTTRLAMAAFMNRLGIALTPTVIFETESVPGPDDSAFVFGCTTDEIVPTFPQQGVAIASVFLFANDADAIVTVRLAYSTDGGTNWNTAARTPGGADARWPSGAAANRSTVVTVHGSAVPMQPGTGYRFAVGLNQTSGAGVINTMSCRMTLMLFNGNPATPPL